MGESTMTRYVHKLYMHDGIMSMELSMETPYNVCMSIEYLNRGANTMSNCKVEDETLTTSEIVKWARPQTC